MQVQVVKDTKKFTAYNEKFFILQWELAWYAKGFLKPNANITNLSKKLLSHNAFVSAIIYA